MNKSPKILEGQWELSFTQPLIVCYGMGVDSTAMLVGLKARGIVPDRDQLDVLDRAKGRYALRRAEHGPRHFHLDLISDPRIGIGPIVRSRKAAG